MTIEIIEGFNFADSGAEMGAGWAVSGAPTMTVAGGRTYGNCVRCTQITSTKVGLYKRNFDGLTGSDGFSAGFDIKFDALPENGEMTVFALDRGTSSLTDQAMKLNITVDGHVKIHGNSTTALDQFDVGLEEATWYHIELTCLCASTGYCNLYINGIWVGQATGNFNNGAYDHRVHLCKWAQHSTDQLAGDYVEFDNFYFDFNPTAAPSAALGRTVVKPLLAWSDGPLQEWTGSYSDIDDPLGSSDADGTYITIDAPNKTSEFGVEDVEAGLQVYAVKTLIEVRKTNEESGSVRAIVRSGGSQDQGADIALTTSYVVTEAVFENNPATGSAWDVASANAMTIGVESR